MIASVGVSELQRKKEKKYVSNSISVESFQGWMINDVVFREERRSAAQAPSIT